MLLRQNKRIRTILILVFLLIANSLFSQTREDTVARIISYGIGVYAKDTFSYLPYERQTLDSLSKKIGNVYNVIQDLKNDSNVRLHILGQTIGKWVDRSKSFNDTDSYEPLIREIEQRLYNGGIGQEARMWRKQNVHRLFTEPVNAYLRGFDKPDGSYINKEYENPVASKKNNESDNGPILTTAREHDMIAIMALFFSGLSFLGVIAILFYLGRKQRKGR